MGMKLTIILIYQIIFHRYHVLQTATKITKYRTGYKPLHRTVIQFSKYATATTKNSSPPPSLGTIANINHQESDGGEGGTARL